MKKTVNCNGCETQYALKPDVIWDVRLETGSNGFDVWSKCPKCSYNQCTYLPFFEVVKAILK